MFIRGFQVVQGWRVCPPMQEMWVWSLGWEDLLEAVVATCPSALAWRIPQTQAFGRLQSMGLQRHTHTHTHTKYGPTIPRGLWLILVAHQANKIEAQAIWAEFPWLCHDMKPVYVENWVQTGEFWSPSSYWPAALFWALAFLFPL